MKINKLLVFTLLLLICQSYAGSIIVFWNSDSKPGTINVKSGDTVTFYSTDGKSHTVESADGKIKSSSFSGSADSPGTYSITVDSSTSQSLSSPGESITATLSVTEASTGSTPTSPPTTPSPTTPSPTTPSPTTPSPTTPSPTTPSPETPSPETPSPETPSPETPSPETPSPTTPSTTPGGGSSSEQETTSGGSSNGGSSSEIPSTSGSASEGSSSEPSTPGSSGEETSECSVSIEHILNDKWTYKDITYTIYQVKLTNTGSKDLESIQIQVTPAENLYHIWEFSYENSILSFPKYRTISPVKPSESLYFGYITNTTTPLTLTSSPTCTGEQPTETPTQQPTEAPTEGPTEAPTEAPTEGPTEAPTEGPTEAPTEGPTEAPTEGPTEVPTEAPSGECLGVLEETVVTTWYDNGVDPFAHISGTISNKGSKTITSATFDLSGVSQIWSVDKNGENSYKLPDYQNSIEPGASFSFGYIVPSHPDKGLSKNFKYSC